jgi:hypothetical protein
MFFRTNMESHMRVKIKSRGEPNGSPFSHAPKSKTEGGNPMHEFKVFITETVTRPVWIAADNPAQAERIAEENYNETEVTAVSFEADPMSRRIIEN